MSTGGSVPLEAAMLNPDFVVKLPAVGEIAGSGPMGLMALGLCLVALLMAVWFRPGR